MTSRQVSQTYHFLHKISQILTILISLTGVLFGSVIEVRVDLYLASILPDILVFRICVGIVFPILFGLLDQVA